MTLSPEKAQLSACPFCGAPAETEHTGDTHENEVSVSCSDAECCASVIHCDHEQWNRRSPVREGVIEECARVCEEITYSREYHFDPSGAWCGQMNAATQNCVRAIRSLSAAGEGAGESNAEPRYSAWANGVCKTCGQETSRCKCLHHPSIAEAVAWLSQPKGPQPDGNQSAAPILFASLAAQG